MAEKVFGDRTFRVGEVLATESILLQARLMQIIGGAVERLPTILGGTGEATPEQKAAAQTAAIAALADICVRSEPRVVASLISDIIGYTMVQGKSGAWGKANLDVDFTQHKGDIFPVCSWVLREVLGDFFSGLLASGALQRMGQA